MIKLLPMLLKFGFVCVMTLRTHAQIEAARSL